MPINSFWLQQFESEFFLFPDCKNDDQVDSVTQYLIYEKHKNYKQANIRGLWFKKNKNTCLLNVGFSFALCKKLQVQNKSRFITQNINYISFFIVLLFFC